MVSQQVLLRVCECALKKRIKYHVYQCVKEVLKIRFIGRRGRGRFRQGRKDPQGRGRGSPAWPWLPVAGEGRGWKCLLIDSYNRRSSRLLACWVGFARAASTPSHSTIERRNSSLDIWLGSLSLRSSAFASCAFGAI